MSKAEEPRKEKSVYAGGEGLICAGHQSAGDHRDAFTRSLWRSDLDSSSGLKVHLHFDCPSSDCQSSS